MECERENETSRLQVAEKSAFLAMMSNFPLIFLSIGLEKVFSAAYKLLQT